MIIIVLRDYSHSRKLMVGYVKLSLINLLQLKFSCDKQWRRLNGNLLTNRLKLVGVPSAHFMVRVLSFAFQ